MERFSLHRAQRLPGSVPLSRTRQPRLTFQALQELACEISDQMFDHWDFYAQMQGLLKNDFRAPKTIEHMFPRHVNRMQEKLIKDNIPEKDRISHSHYG